MHWRRQGDLGEASALLWLAEHGWDVFVPVGHSEGCDLVAARGGELIRVQVKTSTCARNDRWEVTICTRGGNQSWSGLVKRFGADRCDWLFVHVGDGRRWFIPAGEVEGGHGILLGGPKYERFEVESGSPLPAPVTA